MTYLKKQEIIKLYTDKNESIVSLSRMYYTPYSVILRILKDSGTQIKVKRDIPARDKLVVQKYKSGVSCKELAKEFGFAPKTLYKILARHKVNIDKAKTMKRKTGVRNPHGNKKNINIKPPAELKLAIKGLRNVYERAGSAECRQQSLKKSILCYADILEKKYNETVDVGFLFGNPPYSV